MSLSTSTWLARLWQEAAQIFDKWRVEGAKGEHDGPDEQHPDVQAVAAHLAASAPPDITIDQPTIAEHIMQVVSGMTRHAEILINESGTGADDGDPTRSRDDAEVDPKGPPPSVPDDGADDPPPETETDPGKDQPKGKKGKAT